LKSKKNHKLVVVAHPDDETLFFAGLMLTDRKQDWHVICVTDGNADGLGEQRHQQFANACKKLGVKKFDFLNLPDHYESRLNLGQIKTKLKLFPMPREVYTHGPIGEYGHPHHQDVSVAVHEYFGLEVPVWGVAQNCSPDRVIRLRRDMYQIKCDILANIYFGETQRFIHFVQNYFYEGFCKFDLVEVRALYAYFNDMRTQPPVKLKKYKWFRPYLEPFKNNLKKRIF
jgi:LmbE family N-acetylglucosaminyl deacetylase